MRHAAVTTAGLILLALPASAREASEPAPRLHLKASVSTAGPYGESWYLTLAPDGAISLQVFYSSGPSGSLLAKFNLGEAGVRGIREALVTEKFFDLPSETTPKETHFHRPGMTIEVDLGGRHHAVRVYDPERLGDRPELTRFFAVWAKVFDGLPFRPSW